MKIQITIDAPTIECIEAELRKVLDNMRHNGKCCFVKEDQSKFCNTTIQILDSNLMQYAVGLEEDEDTDSNDIIQYCNTETEAQRLVDENPAYDIWDLDPTHIVCATPKYLDI